MAEEPQEQPGTGYQGEEFPPWNFPTLLSDGVVSMAYGPEVCRFYLGRRDPSIKATGANSLSANCQVVMPTSSFVNTALFFEHMVRVMSAADPNIAHLAEETRKHYATVPNVES